MGDLERTKLKEVYFPVFNVIRLSSCSCCYCVAHMDSNGTLNASLVVDRHSVHVEDILWKIQVVLKEGLHW